MSASSLPYRLRPNKFVDRELFAELVSLLVADRGTDSYVYISMGGNHLSDHLAIYRRAGLRKLYAFDSDPDVVMRQRFNAPFDGIVCESHTSAELISHIDGIVETMGVQNVIVWLDYTEPKHLDQLGEIQTLSRSLQTGDILRVTMNVDFQTLHKREAELNDREKSLPVDEKRAALMKRALGGFLPRRISRIGQNGIPGAVAESVARACQMGLEDGPRPNHPIPLLVTEYRDSSAMLTVTMLICDSRGEPRVPGSWSFLPTNWSSVERIIAPDLSPRERMALDKKMHGAVDGVASILGFPLEPEAVRSYARFHRFYPTFQAVGD